MTKLTEPTRTAMRDDVKREEEHRVWQIDVKRRLRAGEDADTAFVADLAALAARDAYRSRAFSIAIETRGGRTAPDLDALQSDGRRITDYLERRWTLSGLWRRDVLDSHRA